MSETTTEPTTEPAATTEQTRGEPAELGEGGKKALDAERAARKAAEKLAADARAELDKIQRANESALEKAQREAKEAQEAASKATSDALRLRVAVAKGLPEALVNRLQGSTEEELAADAESLLALVRTPTAPQPDLSQGAKGASSGGSTAEQFAAAVQNAFS